MKTKEKNTEQKNKLLELLTYEKTPKFTFYYKNYNKVISGELNPEAVMGSSGLQAYLIKIIVSFLLQNIDSNKYEVLFNEVGFQISKNHWRSIDIAIFKKDVVNPFLTSNKLIPVPPIIAIEIDTKADTSKLSGGMEFYIRNKTQDLLNAGVNKVIWFTTNDKKVLIADNNNQWIISNWNHNITIVDNITLNLHSIIKANNLNL